MKWFAIAQVMLPALAFVPGMAPLVPFISSAVHDAQALHGDTNDDAKRALVVDSVNVAVATGKVQIDPKVALAVTNAVLQTIDNVHQTIKANQPHLDTAAATQQGGAVAQAIEANTASAAAETIAAQPIAAAGAPVAGSGDVSGDDR